MSVNVPFCQTGEDGGFESTSHFKDTGIPSRIGMPNPGFLLIPKEGVSIIRNTVEVQCVSLHVKHYTNYSHKVIERSIF